MFLLRSCPPNATVCYASTRITLNLCLRFPPECATPIVSNGWYSPSPLSPSHQVRARARCLKVHTHIQLFSLCYHMHACARRCCPTLLTIYWASDRPPHFCLGDRMSIWHHYAVLEVTLWFAHHSYYGGPLVTHFMACLLPSPYAQHLVICPCPNRLTSQSPPRLLIPSRPVHNLVFCVPLGVCLRHQITYS